MLLLMNNFVGTPYSNNSQKTRVITERWFSDNMFCPRCGSPRLSKFENNRPVADFYCPKCSNQFELKSKNGLSLETINDGAYGTMIERINSADNPDFFFLSYHRQDWRVQNLFFVPKHFFTPGIIQKRAPLSSSARRAGWTGCNILLSAIPAFGKIPIVRNGIVSEKTEVLKRVAAADSLEISDIDARGWLLDVLSCVEQISRSEFSLAEIYAFETRLAQLHPKNHNVQAKIRQQLQVLRDRGVIEFLGRGKYRRIE